MGLRDLNNDNGVGKKFQASWSEPPPWCLKKDMSDLKRQFQEKKFSLFRHSLTSHHIIFGSRLSHMVTMMLKRLSLDAHFSLLVSSGHQIMYKFYLKDKRFNYCYRE
jgi:hypothetical protein